MKSTAVASPKILFKKSIGPAFLVLIPIALFTIYNQWDNFVLAAIQIQKTLHGMLADHIKAVANNTSGFGYTLIALSFGYGVFHAVGPGHGKAVIVTYLGTHKESVSKGIFLSFAAAILQSLIAIALVLVLTTLFKVRFSQIHNYGNSVALASYALVFLLGFMLVLKAGSGIYKTYKLSKHIRNSHHDHDHGDSHDHSHDHQNIHHDHDHDHGHDHAHIPKSNESVWQSLAVIITMGIRPCSGAIVVLIYAQLVGVFYYGVFATLLMGLGTGLSVSLIALGALYTRSWLESFISEKPSTKSLASKLPMSAAIRLSGGVILMVLGWSFFMAAMSISSAGHPLF